jgi:hypothetical protein
MDRIFDLHPTINLLGGCLPNYIADLPYFSHEAANVEMKSLTSARCFLSVFPNFKINSELTSYGCTYTRWPYPLNIFDEFPATNLKLILVRPCVLLKLNATNRKHQLEEMEVRASPSTSSYPLRSTRSRNDVEALKNCVSTKSIASLASISCFQAIISRLEASPKLDNFLTTATENCQPLWILELLGFGIG